MIFIGIAIALTLAASLELELVNLSFSTDSNRSCFRFSTNELKERKIKAKP